MFPLLAAAAESPDLTNDLEKGLHDLDRLPGDVAQLPMLHHLAEVIPLADLAFGGGVLMIVMLVHAIGLRVLGDHVSRRVHSVLRRPSLWHADLLMGSIIFLLLALHLFEIFVWSSALVFSGLIPNWHDAGFFAGNTYTTIGYGNFVLTSQWEMVAPIMAISGLFTFGWSGSVLVDYVRRIQQIRDAARARKQGDEHPHEQAHEPTSEPIK
jgi:hypothetical protein